MIPIKSRWKKLTTPEVQQSIKIIAEQYGIDPNWLCKMIWIESRFNPTAENPKTHATGYWQALPSTAASIGISSLYSYTATRQVELIARYWNSLGIKYGSMNSEGDVYLSIFYPAAIDKPKDWSFPNIVYVYNSPFDESGDKVITKREVLNYVAKS